MKGTPYSAYKPSGIDWLGDIPANWDVRRLKDWVSINREVLPDTTNPDYEIHYLEIGAVGTGRLLDEPVRLRFSNAPSRARRIVRAGDTIISTVRTYLKAVWFADDTDDDLICSTGFAVLTPRNGTIPKFVSYSVQSDSFTDRVTADTVGIAYPAIGEGRLSSFHIAVPPLDEQTAIVGYLDRADERIQRAISAKERLIELLTEQRQAVIHHAVTRGLDPNMRLKDSGVEWLGEVPSHWEVRRLRYTGEAIIGLTYSPQDVVDEEAGMLVLRASNIMQGRINYQDSVFVNCPVPERLVVRRGDILICSRSGSRALIGKNAKIDSETAGATFGAFMTVFRSENNDYLHHVFNSKLFENQSGAFLTSTINQLTLGILNDFKVPWPPAEERFAVVRYIDKATADIDAAIDNAQRQIDLLREYRTRLITDAVSGRVDMATKTK